MVVSETTSEGDVEDGVFGIEGVFGGVVDGLDDLLQRLVECGEVVQRVFQKAVDVRLGITHVRLDQLPPYPRVTPLQFSTTHEETYPRHRSAL